MIIGDTIGKYRLVNRLGHGGMGEVWLATASGHGGFTKNVVLKTLLPEYAHDPLFIEMLAHEARICAKLSHPNLIEVFDFSEHGGIYLLAMEHVVGRPLHHIMRAAKARSWSVPAWFALRVAWECCRGLQYAHEQGVIHCDMSPSNVMVTFAGLTKILDFGVAHSIARGPRADRLKGKVSYMAPERIKSLATDCRTDIYSLGVMLYLVFTGQLPFTASNDSELLHKIVKSRPQAPSEIAPVDSRIERLILRAMQPDPAQRFQTVGEVLAELAPCLEGQLGAYGQHDVANFVGRLFDAPRPVPRPPQKTERIEHGFPVVPAPPAGDVSDAVTRPPGTWGASQEIKIDDFDIEVASSVLEIPIEQPPPPPSAKPVRLARSSSESAPLDRATDEGKKSFESLSKLFAHVPELQEARTSVQSLFGDRPSSLAFGPSKIFERPPLDRPIDRAPLDRAPLDRPLLDRPLPERLPLGTETDPPALDADAREPAPPPADSPEVTRTARPGGFGSYSSARPQSQTAWPWSSSRTKSD